MNPKKGQFSMPGFEGTSAAFDSLIKSGESIVEKRKGNTGQTAGAFLEGNPNRTTYSYSGKAKDLSAGLRLAGRANPMGPNTNIHVDMKDPNKPQVRTKLRRK